MNDGSPEARMRARERLLDALRSPFLDPSPDRDGGAPFAEADWNMAYDEAGRLGVRPLAYVHLAASAISPDIPDGVLEALRRDYMSNAAVNMLFYADLKDVLTAFREAGIRALVLKGAYLAESVYGNIGARTLSDVDLLVRREDLERADGVLVRLGYSPRERRRFVSADTNEFHYRRATTGLLLELHWELVAPTYPFRIETEELWVSARPFAFAGAGGLVLSPEDQLIHTGLHASIHMYLRGLRDLFDIAELVLHFGSDLDWDRLRARANRWRVAKCVHLPLLLAGRILGAAIPEDFLRDFQPRDFEERFYEAARNEIFDAAGGAPREARLNPNLALAFGRKGARAKWAVVRDRVFPSRNRLAAEAAGRVDSWRYLARYPGWILKLLRRNVPAGRKYVAGRMRLSKKRRPAGNEADLMAWLVSP